MIEGVSQRNLLVLRHAKSDWPDGVPDHERPVAARGRREAPLVGQWLHEHGPMPDLVVCSPALRARQTWDLVTQELPAPPEVRLDERVYDAPASQLLTVIGETPDEVTTLLLIGHNPSTEELAGLLAGGGDKGALDRMRAKFPTAALAVLAFDAAWSDLEPGGAQLVDFVVARPVSPR
jgi:phosphohistidine phosphatase